MKIFYLLAGEFIVVSVLIEIDHAEYAESEVIAGLPAGRQRNLLIFNPRRTRRSQRE